MTKIGGNVVRIPAIRVRQWLNEWNDYDFDEASRQRKPQPYFYICSMSAPLLRRLSGVRRREAVGPRAADLRIQRGHDVIRSNEIGRFIKAGYPWASLNTEQQQRFPKLRKPGWLPTAVVANLISSTTMRDGVKAEPRDLVTIDTASNELVHLILPDGSQETSWEPAANSLEPIEIIDGQHRLYAFSEDEELDGDFELPVILFEDLDISWQAYLFWSINVTPKRINPSMAYDLYPLLRTADWLEQVEGPMTYRETRAQELTEALWRHPESPWQERIGMLGREKGKVTQAAFVRSLTLSFVRGWSGSRRTGIGGFFGTEISEERTDVLQWARAQQAAYLIELWSSLGGAISASGEEWARHLRQVTSAEEAAGHDPAFAGRFSMLATDQGVRGFLQVCNDLSYQSRYDIAFSHWQRPTSAEATDIAEVTEALEGLREQTNISNFIEHLTSDIANFDWRSAVTPDLPHDVEIFQSRYRGGSGYKQVRLQLLQHLARTGSDYIATCAQSVAQALGYDKE